MSTVAGTSSAHVLVRLRRRDYAIAAAEVVEVLRMAAVRPLPEAPDWILGVLNLRGRGVPIMDLARRLGLEPLSIHPDMAIVVVLVNGKEIGLVVDEIVDVITLDPQHTESRDAVLGVSGMFSSLAHREDRSILVLDLGAVVRS